MKVRLSSEDLRCTAVMKDIKMPFSKPDLPSRLKTNDKLT